MQRSQSGKVTVSDIQLLQDILMSDPINPTQIFGNLNTDYQGSSRRQHNSNDGTMFASSIKRQACSTKKVQKSQDSGIIQKMQQDCLVQTYEMKDDVIKEPIMQNNDNNTKPSVKIQSKKSLITATDIFAEKNIQDRPRRLVYRQKQLQPHQKQRMVQEFYQMYDRIESIQWLLFQKMKTNSLKNQSQYGKKKTDIHWMKTVHGQNICQQESLQANKLLQSEQLIDQQSTSTFYDQAGRGAKSSLLLLNQIYNQDIELLRELKQGFLETKQRIQRVEKEKLSGPQADQSRTCKICNANFQDGRQLGGHMSKKHPGRSYEYKIKMLMKSNKFLENQRRLYFKALNKGKNKQDDNQKDKEVKQLPKKTKKIRKQKKKGNTTKPKIESVRCEPLPELNQFDIYEEHN